MRYVCEHTWMWCSGVSQRLKGLRLWDTWKQMFLVMWSHHPLYTSKMQFNNSSWIATDRLTCMCDVYVLWLSGTVELYHSRCAILPWRHLICNRGFPSQLWIAKGTILHVPSLSLCQSMFFCNFLPLFLSQKYHIRILSVLLYDDAGGDDTQMV